MPLPDEGIKTSALPVATSADAIDITGVQGGVTKKLPSGLLATQAELDAEAAARAAADAAHDGSTGAHIGTLARATDQRTSLKDTRVGAALDGVADDTAKLQTALDLTGDTTTLRGGGLFHPGGRARLTGTVTADRKTLSFEGVGPGGSGGGGSLLAWDGAAGLPMVKVRRSWGLRLSGLRFVGKSTAKPSAAVSIRNEVGDANVNTGLELENLWVGSISGFDTDNASQFERGIYTEGNNVQNDQSSMRDIHVEGCTVAGIELGGSQNVIWELATVVVNSATVGFRSVARHTVGTNWFFSSNATADIEFAGDASLKVTNFGSEGSARFIRALNGADISIERGYFQSNAAIPADGAVIDLSGAGTGRVALRLKDFSFARSADPWTFAQEKIRVRGATALIVLDNVVIPGPPATVLDLTTANAGETRHVILRNVSDVVGVRYNGEYRWTHGDTVPNLDASTVGVPMGSAAQPGLSFLDDPNTGIRRSAVDTMTFVGGGGDGMSVGSGGLVTLHNDLRASPANAIDFGTAAARFRNAYLSGALDHSGSTVKLFGRGGGAAPAANADTTGATLAALETEVNELKAALRAVGVIAT